MGRGRKRKFNPAIPSHVDQQALPQGLYWESNRWFMYEPHKEGGRLTKRTVALASARLSELHAIVEAARGGSAQGTLAYLCDHFLGTPPIAASSEFKELAAGTQKDYRQCAAAACSYVLKDGSTLGKMQVARMNIPMIQRLVETLANGRSASASQPLIEPRPSKANHVLRFLRRLFSWGMRFGLCAHNPAKGVRQARELAEHKMPESDAFATILDFARQRGRLKAHSLGSVSPYLHAVMQLAYNLRLRGVEVTELTDAHADEVGIRSNRRKGSRDNITTWNDELREAWQWLVGYRKDAMSARGRPVELKPEKRRLLVNQSGTPLSKGALDSAWQRMMQMAIREKVIREDQRFSLHGLKHRGITDTVGNRADKQDAAGHKSPQMTQRYDHQVPVVSPPKKQ
ncbi:tyrosine-type recombinase/integrase [Xanthomonas citri pv. glycines]|uniref:Tyr recombinase domain-containing protein n=1 Tax=Xanthomonas arboricola pv. corylina TaxID=487821 RepID=A0A8D6YE13_9XANT|nr:MULTISPECIES: tyrosine-type recombinase/integrase [Xanthomonas]AOY62122.1 integrase [Xanthomonas citri pv. glycines str. 8ra]ARV24192.1 integrase [Xanthomonas citri pv. glycines str. 12-2]EWC49145.1 phage-related integrase [Xanthomonas citri pv. glycines str. 8ra]PPU45516.1 integrase [Xanthomonas arboricola]QDR46252.1 tyrosine-type recombinase/integrase [Xanthomonas citri pv. glycines]